MVTLGHMVASHCEDFYGTSESLTRLSFILDRWTAKVIIEAILDVRVKLPGGGVSSSHNRTSSSCKIPL